MNKIFYENKREQNLELAVFRHGRYVFDQHFHINVEILIVKKGKYKLFYNGKGYAVGADNVAFIDSYELHGYGVTGEEARGDALLVIPFTYLEKFNSFRKKAKIINPVIQDAQLVDNLLSLVDRYLSNEQPQEIREAGIDLILALIEQKLEYSKNKESDDTVLVKKILQYIEKNFKEDVSLTAIAKALGYTKEHLSRTFNKCLKQSITTYINRLRLQYIEKVLSSTDKNLTDVIFESGFNSVPTYYRCKKQFLS